MGYTADQGGKWRKRWAEIHKIPAEERLSVSKKDQQAALALDRQIAQSLARYISTDVEGKEARELMDAGRAALSGSDYWAIEARAVFLKLGRRILTVRAWPADKALECELSKEDFAPLCSECSGSGMVGPAAFDRVPDPEEIARRAAATPGVLSAEKRDAMIPKPVRDSDARLLRALDKSRSLGHFDGLIREIESAIDKMPTKHLVDYQVLMNTVYAPAGKPVAMAYLGRLSPVVGSDWSPGGKSGENEKPAPLLYCLPCSGCRGEGAG